uniref:cyd operon protein YbgE n=1 Tax=Thaumasiovibrio occultus TaxID=1891184 RepID=UPI000B359689|nr:cyd operon protein YbgE [Thaumasiovibrio occultus]
MNHGLLRTVVLLLGLVLVGSVMWEPTQFADAIGGFNFVRAVLLIWGCCAAMVYGVGFVPIKWYWQLFFTPYLSSAVVITFIVLRFM